MRNGERLAVDEVGRAGELEEHPKATGVEQLRPDYTIVERDAARKALGIQKAGNLVVAGAKSAVKADSAGRERHVRVGRRACRTRMTAGKCQRGSGLIL